MNYCKKYFRTQKSDKTVGFRSDIAPIRIRQFRNSEVPIPSCDLGLCILLDSVGNRVESIPFHGIDVSSEDSSIFVKYQKRRLVLSKNAWWRNIAKNLNAKLVGSEGLWSLSCPYGYFFQKNDIVCIMLALSRTCTWRVLCRLHGIDVCNHKTTSLNALTCKNVGNANASMYCNGFEQICNWSKFVTCN